MADLTALWQIIQVGGGPALVAILFTGFLQKWIVPGWLYQDVVKDRDAWRAKAESSLNDRQLFTEWVLKVIQEARRDRP